MKPFLLPITAAALCLTLAGCGSTTPEVPVDTAPDSVESTETTPEGAGGSQEEGAMANMTAEEREAMMASMTDEEREAMMAERGGEGMTRPEGMEDMTDEEREAMMAERGGEGMTRPEGMEGFALPEGVELPEGFEDMTVEEREALMAEMGIELPEGMEGGRPAMAEGENLPPIGDFVGEVVEVQDNQFQLLSSTGETQTITIPKDLTVANGDYTRILEGMNLAITWDDSGVITSVVIVQAP